jgi:hypothetical protein
MTSILSSISGILPLAIAGIAATQVPQVSNSPSSENLAIWWILGAAGAAVILNNILDAWRKITGNFKERESAGPEYVQKSDCKDVHKTMTDQWEEAEQRHTTRTESLRQEIKSDIKGVHKRIDEILSAVSELKGKIYR